MEFLIENSPSWLKKSYVAMLQLCKQSLARTGILAWLDKQSQTNRRYHYWRSLLALHQLPDMIALDTPWWTYAAIDAIEQHFKACQHPLTVFEYGSGASTIWLAKRCQHIVSIEHDASWFAHLDPWTKSNPQIQLKWIPAMASTQPKCASPKVKGYDFQNYVSAIQQDGTQYDVIVIDGRCRGECLHAAKTALKPNGIIIFDNANRARYQDALHASALRIQRYPGWVPGSPFKSETAILRH